MPLRYLIFVEQVGGNSYFEYLPEILIQNRIKNFDDYEVYGSLDVVSYFTYKLIYEDLSNTEKEIYGNRLKWILTLIDNNNFSYTTRNKLLIESYQKNEIKVFELLYCSFNVRKDSVSYFYMNINKEESLDLVNIRGKILCN